MTDLLENNVCMDVSKCYKHTVSGNNPFDNWRLALFFSSAPDKTIVYVHFFV